MASAEAIIVNANETQKTTTTNSQNTPQPPASSSVERYRQEWQQLLKDLDKYSDHRIRERAFHGELKVSKFRSVYWALLLRVLSIDYKDWQNQRIQQRRRYEKLRQDFHKNPHDAKEPDDNPLSQSTKSIWNQYFSDQELFAVIRQDVIRTFPGVDFFRKAIIQNAMCNILFYYAREHPYMCYRQGMHEILAPILFVVYSDQQSLLHYIEIASKGVDPILLDVLNPGYFEEDVYSLFARLMSSIEAYYRISNLEPTRGGEFYSPQLSLVATEIEVIGQLNSIRDKILAKEDLHLHNYLLKLDIPLHLFGIRWLRLLFGREFPLLDLLLLWDAIFADSDNFNLPNYILVAMLIRIRDKLFLSDYTSCLTYLMRYPAKSDVNLILQHALHMLMPKIFERPPNAFVYVTQEPNSIKMNKDPPTKLMPSSSLDRQERRIRSVSLNGAVSQIEKQINAMQTFNAADIAAAQTRFNKHSLESDTTVIDGYSSNSPELLRLELRNAQTVINIARSKLCAYLDVVRKHTDNTKTKSEELHHAIEGIEELCLLLDIKYMFPLHARRAPIDLAFEANELKSVSPNESLKQHSSDRDTTLKKTKTSSPTSLNEVDIKESRAANIQIGDSFAGYERPEDCINTARLLGNIREIELIPIISDEKVEDPLNNES